MTPTGTPSAIDLSAYRDHLLQVDPVTPIGYVTQITGLVVEVSGLQVPVGQVCTIFPKEGGRPVSGEVVGFRGTSILLMPLGEVRGIGPRSWVVPEPHEVTFPVGRELLGRVIDGLGKPLDGKPLYPCRTRYPIYAEPMNPLLRQRIRQPLDVGIRCVNGLLTLGKGQRVGIMSGSGVGKSVLLGMIARNTSADITVIALIGERGREVKEFIEGDLGAVGLQRCCVVAATSDTSPLVRMRGAFIATTIAEYFRDQGQDVLLLMDSITRFAMAQREIGLSIGEPPTTKGYTPSVYALMPKLIERAGMTQRGSITGLYAVLVEGDDLNEPIGDAVRSLVDGHIVLSRELANRNHYPAVDVLASRSRLMIHVTEEDHQRAAGRFLSALATYRAAEDLINIGAYVRGSSPEIDFAMDRMARFEAYLRQGIQDLCPLAESVVDLQGVVT